MIDLVELFREGGLWSYLLLLLILAGLGVAAAGLGFQGFGRRLPGALWLAVPALVMLVGLLGTLSGLAEMEQALALVSEDMRSALMARGTSVSLSALVLAGAGLSLLGVLGAGGIGLGAAIGAGPSAQVRPLHIGVAAGGAFLVVAASGWGALSFTPELGGMRWGAPLLALLGGGGVALAALRASEAPEWEGRSAANVAAAGTCAATSLLGFALFSWASNCRLGFNALAVASPEYRDQLLAAVQQATAQGLYLGLLTAGALGLLALGVVALDGTRALSGRNPLMAGIMAIPLLVVLGTAGFALWRVSVLV